MGIFAESPITIHSFRHLFLNYYSLFFLTRKKSLFSYCCFLHIFLYKTLLKFLNFFIFYISLFYFIKLFHFVIHRNTNNIFIIIIIIIIMMIIIKPYAHTQTHSTKLWLKPQTKAV